MFCNYALEGGLRSGSSAIVPGPKSGVNILPDVIYGRWRENGLTLPLFTAHNLQSLHKVQADTWSIPGGMVTESWPGANLPLIGGLPE